MFDGLYTKLTYKVGYKKLLIIPQILLIISVFLIATKGLEYGIDFKGGTWMDALTDLELTQQDLASIEQRLGLQGLEDVKAHVGYDVDTGKNKLTIQSTTVVTDQGLVLSVLEELLGPLTEYDTASVSLTDKPPVQLKEKLDVRLGQRIDLDYADNTLTITGLDLQKEELDSALTYYLSQDMDVTLSKKNYNIRSVGPTLGQTFRRQGFMAVAVALLLMGVVVFLAFKDLIPSVAVIQAAIADLVIAVGGMSLFGIPMEPASLAALLMLIGYSVDTDIMLTARVLKDKSLEFDRRLEDAMLTGLTMTGTTLTVMVIVYVISTTLTQITTLSSIASVLIIGLVADVATTWFTNAGILRWYLEVPGRKIRIFGKRRGGR